MLAKSKMVTRTDLAFLALSLLMAAVLHATYAGHERPFLELGGDAANIACFAAASEHPELFAGDGLLGDPANFRFYSALQVPLVRWLARRTGDYGLATNVLLGFTIWLYLYGWYVFGTTFWRSRFCGACWALLQVPHITTAVGEFWGVFNSLIPRLSFQALLPWLLVLTMTVARRGAWRWPWLTYLAGLMVWVHPVSAPGWTLAVCLTWGVLSMPGLERRERRHWLALSVVAMVLALLPFAISFVGEKQPPTSIDAQTAASLMLQRINRSFLSVPYALAAFGWHMLKQGVLPLTALGVIALWRHREPLDAPDRERVRLVGAWALGLTVAGVVLPGLDQLLALARHALPFQLDLVRHIRYFVPFLYGLWFWPLRRWCLAASGAWPRRRWALAGAALAWLVIHNPYDLRRPVDDPQSAREAVVAIAREVPPKGRIMPIGFPGLMIRYGALRPVVFTFKDGGCFATVRPDQLAGWYSTYQRYQEIEAMPDSPQRLAAACQLTRDSNAEYLVLTWTSRPITAPVEGATLLFANRLYVLYQVAPR